MASKQGIHEVYIPTCHVHLLGCLFCTDGIMGAPKREMDVKSLEPALSTQSPPMGACVDSGCPGPKTWDSEWSAAACPRHTVLLPAQCSGCVRDIPDQYVNNPSWFDIHRQHIPFHFIQYQKTGPIPRATQVPYAWTPVITLGGVCGRPPTWLP